MLFALLLCGGLAASNSVLQIYNRISDLPLLFAALLFGILLMAENKKPANKMLTHLLMRGMTPSHANRFIGTRRSYALFFKNSGILMSFITFWRLFSIASFTYAEVFGAVAESILIGFISFILYAFLDDTSFPEKMHATCFSKSRLVWTLIMVFLLLIFSLYIYIGYQYLPSDEAFLHALSIVREMLTYVYIGSLGGFLAGTLLGICLHFTLRRFGGLVLSAISCLPLYGLFILSDRFFIPIASLAIPIGCAAAHFALQCLFKVRLLKPLPLKAYGKSVLWPLFYLPLLGQLFKSLFMGIALFAFSMVWKRIGADYLSASIICVFALLFFSIYRTLKGGTQNA